MSRDGLILVTAQAIDQGDTEGRADVERLTTRRRPVRATHLPQDERAARFAQALEDIYEGRDWPMREP